MKVVIAPGTFKGSLTAVEAADAMGRGAVVASPDAEVISCAVGDGGEGTAEALARSRRGSVEVSRTVSGPRSVSVRASYYFLGPDYKTAALDMASASGLLLVPHSERDPLRSTTLGTGELIGAALETQTVERLIIGLGGSATNDCGAGCLQGLGFDLLDEEGNPLGVPTFPLELGRIMSLSDSNFPTYYRGIEVVLACDVSNPLAGPNGATRVFGPQKGAAPETIDQLDKALSCFGSVLDDYAARFTPIFGDHRPISERAGAGAAGGLGAGLMAGFPRAKVAPGIDIVLESSNFQESLRGAALVLTGEGKLDAQTLSGKTVDGVLRHCSKAGVPVIAIVGTADPDAVDELKRQGLAGVIELVDLAGSSERAFAEAADYVARAAYQAVSELPKKSGQTAFLG